MSSSKSIGIFDSGLGGLTVTREIKALMPNESIVYFGDTARVPYGSKSQDSIIQFSREAVDFFIQHDVKCIVFACNSASALALPIIKDEFDIPIIGVIEPGAKAAVETSISNKIGVIGTNATINSDSYTHAIKRLNQSVTVYSQPCPLFVPLIEEGYGERQATTLIIADYLETLSNAKIDTLVLGCTHYPLLKKQIQAFMGPEVKLVDSASTCAKDLKLILEKEGLNAEAGIGTDSFFVSDAANKFSELGTKFLGQRLQAIRVEIG